MKPSTSRAVKCWLAVSLWAGLCLGAADAGQTCDRCAAWNAPHDPFRIYGNTYYVGTDGLSAILITSPRGHVLIDGGLAESVPRITGNISQLGFSIQDVRLILNSHVHYDHAGGLAELQRLSGADVAASPSSAAVLRSGAVSTDDPQYGLADPVAPLHAVRPLQDAETLSVGDIAVTAHFTPGHTPGGTSWSWISCEDGHCLHMVYADSLTAVSADDFRFSHAKRYPGVLEDFARSFAVLEALSCDILLTPHPGASGMWERLAAARRDEPDAWVDTAACKEYADRARTQLQHRIEQEQSAGPS